MAGNSTKVVNFFHDGTNIKAVLVEEAPDEEGSCYLCKSPLRSSPFYTTEPWIFDVHSRCAENCRFIPGQEKSSSPAPGSHHHYKHDKQLAGFQYPWQQQPNVNAYGSVAHVQPMSFSFHPRSYYPQPLGTYLHPYYPQPPNPYPYPYYPQPPNPVSQIYGYRPPANGSINQHAGNEVWRPTNSGTSSAAARLGSSAVSAFLQALFGNILQIGLPFGNN